MSKRRFLFYVTFIACGFAMMWVHTLLPEDADDQLWALTFLSLPVLWRLVAAFVHLWDPPGTNLFGESYIESDAATASANRISLVQALSILVALFLLQAAVAANLYFLRES